MYLVSKIICCSTDRMEKDFKIFHSYEDAVYYKNRLKGLCISEIADYYDILEEEVYQYVNVTEDEPNVFAYTDMDLEVEIAIDNLY